MSSGRGIVLHFGSSKHTPNHRMMGIRLGYLSSRLMVASIAAAALHLWALE